MQKVAKRAESHATHGISQFELTTDIITKLNTFKLTPTAKLVLLYLTTCYNPKHKEVFPKQKTIADKLGISEVSVTRAISELHKEGLVISERKYTNRYKFTSRIVSEQGTNLIDEKRQKDSPDNVNLISHNKEQKKETKKEPQKVDDFKILKEYAIKHGAKNVNAYINVLRKNGSTDKIICEYKKQQKVTQRALYSYKETQEILKRYKEYKKNTDLPSKCEAWKLLGEKLKRK